MKLKLISIVMALSATPALAAMGTTDIPTFAGQAAAQAAAKTGVPKTPEEWLARMTDFTRNLSAFKDPKVFVPWTNAVTEPGFYVAMMNGMMDPGGWLNMMNTAANPDAVRNIVQFADPNILLKWAVATGDPGFYTALLTQLSDPGKAMRWAMLPVDAKLWNTLLSTLNPNTYIRWGMSGLDPRAWNLAGTMANPALYTGMLGALVNPNTYGQGTNAWLTWMPQPSVQGAGSFAMWDPVAMLGNLSGFIPGVNPSALPSLPNIGLPTITLPTFPVPAFNPAPLYAPTAPATAPAPAAKPAEAAKPAVEATPAAEAPKSLEAPKAEAPKSLEAPKAEVKAAAAPTPAAKPVEVAKPAEAPKTEVKVAPAPAPVVAVAPVATPVAAPSAKPAATSSKVILAGDALFLSGKSGIKDLSRDGKTRLDEVVTKIKAMGEIEQIKVIGHADPTGKAKTNRALSEARAKSVKSYLVAKGIKPGVIITSGMGDTQPVAQCDKSLKGDALKACHAPNRRVEIEITGKAK